MLPAIQIRDIHKNFGQLHLPNRIGCRICADLPGGWKTPEPDWPDLQDRMLNAMVRLEAALKAPVQALRV